MGITMGKKAFKLPYPYKKVSLYQLTSLLHTREIKRLTLRKSISLSQKSKVNWDNFPLTCQRIGAQLEHLCSAVSLGLGWLWGNWRLNVGVSKEQLEI